MLEAKKIMEGFILARAEKESVLFGCPSEGLKALKINGEEIPGAIVLPEHFYRAGIVQANPEFFFYNFSFVQGRFFKGEKLKIIGTTNQLKRIKDLLELCVFGPTKEEMIFWGASEEVAEEQIRIAQELGPKNPDGSLVRISDMVEFIEFNNDKAEIGKLIVKRNGDNIFNVTCCEESLSVDLNFFSQQRPPILIKHVKRHIGKPAFGAATPSICTTGFDPSGYTTCWILFINSEAYLVDGVPWIKEHLRSIGINNSDIKGYIISHIHEDHSSIMEGIINGKKARVITTSYIFKAFCKKISLILDWEPARVEGMMDFTEVVAGKPFSLYGAEFNFFNVIHPISTIGFEVTMMGKKIVYSGDTMWGEGLKKLLDKGVISKKTYYTVDKIPMIESDITIMDGGGGMIHPSHTELNKLILRKKDKIFLTHCSKIESGTTDLRTMSPENIFELVPAKSISVGDLNSIINTPMLKEAGNSWINAILSRGKIMEVAEGRVVLKEKLPGKDFYIILSGVLSAILDWENVATLEAGDFFGEMSLMDNIGCTATIKAETNARILAIPKKIFLEMIAVTGLAEKLRKIHRIRPVMIQCGWIKDLPPAIVNKIIGVIDERYFRAGEKIIVQGELGQESFLIRDGRARVIVSGDGTEQKTIATLYPGQFFGEMALLNNQKRNASVIAETDANVLVIKGEDFKNLLNKIPVLLYAFGVMANERNKKH